MIKSFKCRQTEKIFDGEISKRFPVEIQTRALRKLNLIDVSTKIDDLKKPASNHLEILKGKLAGKYSIRINDKYRICFSWINKNAFDVEIVDYHE